MSMNAQGRSMPQWVEKSVAGEWTAADEFLFRIKITSH